MDQSKVGPGPQEASSQVHLIQGLITRRAFNGGTSQAREKDEGEDASFSCLDLALAHLPKSGDSLCYLLQRRKKDVCPGPRKRRREGEKRKMQLSTPVYSV